MPFRRLRLLFEQALDLPAEQRAAFLARECAADPELRADVEQLLAKDAETGAFARLLDRTAIASMHPPRER